MMKARLILAFTLFLLCTGAALAQTPDDQTPAEETVCDNETGAAYGLCNAYCQAMDCDSAAPQASDEACAKVEDKFVNITGRALPCGESVAPDLPCPCEVSATWSAVLSAPTLGCTIDHKVSGEKQAENGTASATRKGQAGGGKLSGTCDAFGPGLEFISLVITRKEGVACVEQIIAACN